MAIEGDKARVTKQQWRTVVISMAAVAFSATAGLEPPLRNLITFARAGASFSTKQLCSSVLMAGMDPKQVLNKDLAAGQGMIHTRIKPNAGRVEASALFGLIRAEAIQNGERGCTWRINGDPTPPDAQAKPAWLRDVPAHWHRLAPDRHSRRRTAGD